MIRKDYKTKIIVREDKIDVELEIEKFVKINKNSNIEFAKYDIEQDNNNFVGIILWRNGGKK